MKPRTQVWGKSAKEGSKSRRDDRRPLRPDSATYPSTHCHPERSRPVTEAIRPAQSKDPASPKIKTQFQGVSPRTRGKSFLT